MKTISIADTLEIQGRSFICKNILTGTVVSDSTAIIPPTQVTQKLAFRPIFDDDPSVLNSFLFWQYPNLKEFS